MIGQSDRPPPACRDRTSASDLPCSRQPHMPHRTTGPPLPASSTDRPLQAQARRCNGRMSCGKCPLLHRQKSAAVLLLSNDRQQAAGNTTCPSVSEKRNRRSLACRHRHHTEGTPLSRSSLRKSPSCSNRSSKWHRCRTYPTQHSMWSSPLRKSSRWLTPCMSSCQQARLPCTAGLPNSLQS
jgi:hypothetical protein